MVKRNACDMPEEFEALPKKKPSEAVNLKRTVITSKGQNGKELLSRLFSMVERFPCIWDHNSSEFMEKGKTDAAWAIIAINMTMNEFGLRCLFNTSWNGGKFNQREEAEQTRTVESTPRTKSIRWSSYYRVKTEEGVIDMPLNFATPILLKKRPTYSVWSVVDTDTEDSLVIRQTLLEDCQEIRRVYRHMILSQQLPMAGIMKPLSVYVANEYMYTVTEMMCSRVSDILDDRMTHFTPARIAYQLINTVGTLHRHGLTHSRITTKSVYVNMDLTVRIKDYGKEPKTEEFTEKVIEDLCAVANVLAELLVEEESLDSLIDNIDNGSVQWKPILQGSRDTGLTDSNAQDLLMLLLRCDDDIEQLLDHPYLLSFHKTTEANRSEPNSLPDFDKISENEMKDYFHSAAESK